LRSFAIPQDVVDVLLFHCEFEALVLFSQAFREISQEVRKGLLPSLVVIFSTTFQLRELFDCKVSLQDLERLELRIKNELFEWVEIIFLLLRKPLGVWFMVMKSSKRRRSVFVAQEGCPVVSACLFFKTDLLTRG